MIFCSVIFASNTSLLTFFPARSCMHGVAMDGRVACLMKRVAAIGSLNKTGSLINKLIVVAT